MTTTTLYPIIGKINPTGEFNIFQSRGTAMASSHREEYIYPSTLADALGEIVKLRERTAALEAQLSSARYAHRVDL